MLRVSPVEASIAYTNLINAFASMLCMGWFIKKGLQNRRNKLWFLAYFFLMLNSLIGFYLHGFQLPKLENTVLWSILYLLLGIMLGRYVLALRYDILNETKNAKSILIVSLVVSAAVAIVNMIDYRFAFPLFSLYGVINVISILVLVSRIVRTDKRYVWYLAAILFFIAGSIVQAMKFIHFTFIFEFNNNSLYHLFLLVFLILQFIGVMKTEDPENKIS